MESPNLLDEPSKHNAPLGDTNVDSPIGKGQEDGMPATIVDEEYFYSEESDFEEYDDEDNISTSDVAVHSDDGSATNENTDRAPKRARRLPVEDFKYQILMSEGKVTYACRACYATYRHKKSLNKHWRDKHTNLKPYEIDPSKSTLYSSAAVASRPPYNKENFTHNCATNGSVSMPATLLPCLDLKRKHSGDSFSRLSQSPKRAKNHFTTRPISQTTPVNFLHGMGSDFPITPIPGLTTPTRNPFNFGLTNFLTPPPPAPSNSISNAVARFMSAYQWNSLNPELNFQSLLMPSLRKPSQSFHTAKAQDSNSLAKQLIPSEVVEQHQKQLVGQQHMPPDFMMPVLNNVDYKEEKKLENALDLTLSTNNAGSDEEAPLDLTASASISQNPFLFLETNALHHRDMTSKLLQPLEVHPPLFHDSFSSPRATPQDPQFHMFPFLGLPPQHMMKNFRDNPAASLYTTPLQPCLYTSPKSNNSNYSAASGTTLSNTSSSASLKDQHNGSPVNMEEDRRRIGGRQPHTICMQCRQHFLSGFELNIHFRTSHVTQLALEFDNVKSWKTTALEEVHNNLEQNIVKLESGESIGFQCPECHYFAKWPTELQKHIMVHSDVRPHICLICGSTYKWKWDLGRHFDKTHGGGVLMPNPYKKTSNPTNNNSNNMVSMTNGNALLKNSSPMNLPMEASSNLMPPVTLTSTVPIKQIEKSEIDHVSHVVPHSQMKSESTITSSLRTTTANVNCSILKRQEKRNKIHHCSTIEQFEKDGYHLHNNEAGDSNDNLRVRLKKKIQQVACKRRNGQPTYSVDPQHASVANETINDTSEAPSLLPFECPMCSFRARWKSELKSHATNHTTCKPFLCPFCQYRSKWKWDVVKHMKRCNWKKHDGGPPSVGPPSQITNKEMQSLIIYKPPAKEEITNLAEAMLYADENSPFYDGHNNFNDDEDENDVDDYDDEDVEVDELNVSKTNGCESVPVFPEPESFDSVHANGDAAFLTSIYCAKGTMLRS